MIFNDNSKIRLILLIPIDIVILIMGLWRGYLIVSVIVGLWSAVNADATGKPIVLIDF